MRIERMTDGQVEAVAFFEGIRMPADGVQAVGDDVDGACWLIWYAEDNPAHKTGEIANVYVTATMRRKGVATSLLAEARKIEPRVHHSDALSDEGRAWSQHVAAFNPASLVRAVPRGSEWVPGYESGEAYYSWTYTAPDGTVFYLRDTLARAIQAWTTSGEAGHLEWMRDGLIYEVAVRSQHQRKGLATAMLTMARSLYPQDNIHHSDTLTPDGKAWSQHVAMPSWRDRGEHPDADCVIAPDTGRRTGLNLFSVYLYGHLEARLPRLAEAKAYVEAIYGPLPWRRIKGDTEPHWDETWGHSVEFNDARYFLVVEHLPRLGSRRAVQEDPSSGPLLEVRGSRRTQRVLALEQQPDAGRVRHDVDRREEDPRAEVGVPPLRRSTGGLGGGEAHLRHPLLPQPLALDQGHAEGQRARHDRTRSQGVEPISGRTEWSSHADRRAGERDSATEGRGRAAEGTGAGVRGQHADGLEDREEGGVVARRVTCGVEEGFNIERVPGEQVSIMDVYALVPVLKDLCFQYGVSVPTLRPSDHSLGARALGRYSRPGGRPLIEIFYARRLSVQDLRTVLAHEFTHHLDHERGTRAFIEDEVADPIEAHGPRFVSLMADVVEHLPRLGSLTAGSLVLTSPETISDGAAQIIYAHQDGQRVGYLWWYTQDDPSMGVKAGEVGLVSVDKQHQRQGIGTRLWEAAKVADPRLHHSQALTDDGAAWAPHVAAKMLDLYHRTTPEAAEAIYRERRMLSKEHGPVYFSTVRDTGYASDYGQGVVHIRVPESVAELDDEFDTGEQHYRVQARDLRPEWFIDPKGRTAAVADNDNRYIARGMRVEVKQQWVAEKAEQGTLTAQDVLNLLYSAGGSGVGIWWGVVGEFGTLEDDFQNSWAWVEDEETLKNALALKHDPETSHYTFGGYMGIVLVAERPTMPDGEPWDPEKHNDYNGLMGNSWLPGVAHGEVRLAEVRYDAGWGWKVLPARGMRAKAALEKEAYGAYQERVYRAQKAVRQVARHVSLDEATVLVRRILMDAGFPDAEEAYADSHPAGYGHSSVAWDMELATAGIIRPVVALGGGMEDELTVIHECAHIIANGPSRRGSRGVGDPEAGHNPQWMAVFWDLVQRYATPDMKRRFNIIFGFGSGNERALGEEWKRTAAIDPERQGLCYPLAFEHLMANDDGSNRLVHGTLAGGRNHAWVEWVTEPLMVYDPVIDEEFDRDLYYRDAGARAGQMYTADQAEEMMARHGHYGPWDGTVKTAGPLRLPVTFVVGPKSVTAHLPDGPAIGFISWYTRDGASLAEGIPWEAGEVETIEVEREYRRRGVAQALWAKAKEVEPRLHHSRVRSDAGDAFARAVDPDGTPREWSLEPHSGLPPRRVTSAALGAARPVEVYRGLPIVMEAKDPRVREILQAISQGATGALADRLWQFMAEGSGVNRWTNQPNGSRTGVGPWWTTDWGMAYQYAYTSESPEDGIEVSVVIHGLMPGDQEYSEDYSGAWVYNVASGTPITVTKIEADLPTRAQAKRLLDLLVKQKTWFDPEGWLTDAETPGSDEGDPWTIQTERVTVMTRRIQTEAAGALRFEHLPGQMAQDVGVYLPADGPPIDTLVAYDGQTAVGHISWYSGGTFKGGVDALGVTKPYRRQGIATALYRRAKQIEPDLDVSMSPWVTSHGRAWIDSLSTLGADDSDDGVMVALVPPLAVTRPLMAAAGATEPEDEQHITLVYLGKTSQVDGDALDKAVTGWATTATPLHGKVVDYGTFDGGENVLYAKWGFEGGQEWRQSLKGALAAQGVDREDTYPTWTPHQTMSYNDEPVTQFPDLPEGLPEDVVFDEVVVAYGTHWKSYPLGG